MKNVMIILFTVLFLVGCTSESNSFSAEDSEDINTVSANQDSVVAFLRKIADDKKDTIEADTIVNDDFTVVKNIIAVETEAPKGEAKRAPEGVRIAVDTVFVIDTVVVYDTIYVEKEAKTRNTKETRETKEESPSKIDTLEIDDSNDGKDDSGEEESGVLVEVEVCDSFCVDIDSTAFKDIEY